MPPRKKAVETTTTEPEVIAVEPIEPIEEEVPQIAERTYSGAVVLCVAPVGGIQIHVLKPECEQPDERPHDEVLSRILTLGDFIPVEDLQEALVEAVKAEREPTLRYAENETEMKVFAMEARAAIADLTVTPDFFRSAGDKPNLPSNVGVQIGAS